MKDLTLLNRNMAILHCPPSDTEVNHVHKLKESSQQSGSASIIADTWPQHESFLKFSAWEHKIMFIYNIFSRICLKEELQNVIQVQSQY